MKILVLSDCHSNVDALNAVWEKESDCDIILFAGDMVDFGFYPKETVRWFMERKDKLFAVRGNHDEWILDNRGSWDVKDPPKSFQDVTFSRLGEEEYQFLSEIPHETTFTIEDTDYYMCHTTDELTDEIFYPEIQLGNLNMRNFFLERFSKKFPQSNAPKKVIVYGHSHLQWAASAGENCMILNPGSLSYRFGSFEPVRCADYTVLENGSVSMRHVNFDTSALLEQAKTLDEDAANLARAFYRIGE